MKQKINWNRVCSNAGLVFFSTLAGTTLVGNPDYVSALISAGIIGAMAFFTEWKAECGDEKLIKLQQIVSSGLVY